MTRGKFSRAFLRDFHERWFCFFILVVAASAIPARAENSVPLVLDLSPPKPFSELSFAPGEEKLDPFAREKLDRLVRDANLRGKIEEVHVISWGDSAGPSAAEKNADTVLAASRARAVENYLDGKGIGLSVKTFNAVKQPTVLEKLTERAGASMQSSLKQAGIPSSGRGSRVVVLLNIRED